MDVKHTTVQPANQRSVEFWQTIKLAYLAGGAVPGLAAQYRVTESCLRKRVSREGWATEKRQLAQTVVEHTVQTCEGAARKFKWQMFAEFDAWFELAARLRDRIADGDYAAFNVVVSGFAKLHSAAFRHHGLDDTPKQPIIIAGLFTGFPEPEEDPATIDTA